MRRWRSWVTWIMVLALLAGCRAAKPEAPPPVPVEPAEPAPQPPAAVEEPLPGCQHYSRLPDAPYMLFYLAHRVAVVQRGTCAVETGESATYLPIGLPVSLTDAEGLAGVVVEPADVLQQTRILRRDGELQIEVGLKAGRPGDRVTVRWRGHAGGRDLDFGLEINRKANPGVVGEIRVGQAAWQPWTEVMVVTPQPLSFRFKATGGLPLEELRGRVEQVLGQTKATVEQTGADTLLVAVPAPPPLLYFDFSGLHAPHTSTSLIGYTVYAGEEPRLVWLDPATGQEQAVGKAPVDTHKSFLSPDGKWALFVAYSPSLWPDRIYVVNTATGQIHLTPFIDSYWMTDVYWQADKLYFGAYERMQVWHFAEARAETFRSQAMQWGPASKDGRFVPGFAVDMDREDAKTWLAPTTVTIFDVQTGTERTFPDLVKVRVPHSSKPFQLPMGWAEDGSYLLLGEATGEITGVTGWQTFRLIPATRTLSSHGDPLPAGARWIEWEAGPKGWQRNRIAGWGPVRLKAPDGSERQFGEGMTVGWAPDGRLLVARWPVTERRVRYGE